MTDSTVHNLGDIQDVSATLETESVPETLICNVHPGVIQKINFGVGRGEARELDSVWGSGGTVSHPSGGVWGRSPFMKIAWLSKAYRLA